MYHRPITRENFQEAWNYGSRVYCRAKKTNLIRILVVPVSQVLFLLLFLMLVFGTLYDGFPGPIRSFLSGIPLIPEIWEGCAPVLLDNQPDLLKQLGILAVLLYLIPLLGGFCMWLLGSLLYHPGKPLQSVDSDLFSRDLWVTSRHAWEYRTPGHSTSLSLCSVLLVLILIGGCGSFLIFCGEDPLVPGLLKAGLGQACFYCLLLILLVFLAYQILNLPLRLVLPLFYRCRVKRQFLEDAENFHWQQTEALKNQETAQEEKPKTEYL